MAAEIIKNTEAPEKKETISDKKDIGHNLALLGEKSREIPERTKEFLKGQALCSIVWASLDEQATYDCTKQVLQPFLDKKNNRFA